MCLETITVYADSYRELQDREFTQMMELAELKGTIRALAAMDDDTDFVMSRLKEMVEKFEKGVDISAA
jgi:hypothetical protein